MSSSKIDPPTKTLRKYVKAYVALGMNPVPTGRQLERHDALARAMSHWYDDELDLQWGCDCEACDWWRESIRAHVVARK